MSYETQKHEGMAAIVGKDANFLRLLEVYLEDEGYLADRIHRFKGPDEARAYFEAHNLAEGAVVHLLTSYSRPSRMNFPDGCAIRGRLVPVRMKSIGSVEDAVKQGAREHKARGYSGLLVLGDGCDHHCTSGAGSNGSCLYEELARRAQEKR